MRAAGLLLLLLAGAAQAQGFGGIFPYAGGGASGPAPEPDPARNDVAASYTATGAGGYGFTAQASLGACGAVRLVWLSPANELRLCDGTSWRRVYTDAEGVLPNADVNVPGYAFHAQAPDGAVAFSMQNNALMRIGMGSATFIKGDGSQILIGSSVRIPNGQVIFAGILSSSDGAVMRLLPGQWVVMQPVGGLPSCDSGVAGGVTYLTTNGRLYLCDGTSPKRVPVVAAEASVTVDPDPLIPGACQLVTITATGALTTDKDLTVIAQEVLDGNLGLKNPRVSAANTVTAKLCNDSTTDTTDQGSTTFHATVRR